MRGIPGLKQPPGAVIGTTKRAAAQWIIPLLTVVIALVTYQQYTLDQKESGSWGCEMSWMTPSYRPIETPDGPIPRYKLWLYREAGWDDDLPSGDPVIFIPGNAGSYMQVRSIASSSSRQYHGHPDGVSGDMHGVRKRDFFTVDYNEEFSAFHAGTILDQARYLAYTIHKVLSLYDHQPISKRPSKVTLLGHSMGGIVARLAALEARDLLDVIFTMSTPHLYPPVTLEYGMEAVYTKINSQVYNASNPLLLSVCGGVSDSQIVSDACALPGSLVGSDGGFAAFGTGIPGAWTSVDHQAMVWCHQIRWRTARVLLETTRSEERSRKLDVAKRWLLGHGRATMDTQIEGRVERRYPVTSKEMSVIIRRGSDRLTDTLPSVSIDTCDSQGRCTPATASIDAFPSPLEPSAPFPLPGEGVKPLEVAYAIRVAAAVDAVELVVRSERNADVSVGDHSTEVITERSWTSSSEVVTHLSLRFSSFIPSALKVYKARVTVDACTGSRPVVRHTSSPRIDLVNTTYESRFFPVNSSLRAIHLHSHVGSAPLLRSERHSEGVLLDIFQDPKCPVTSVSVSIAPVQILAKAVLRYRMLPIAWALGWSSLLFVLQLHVYAREGHFPCFSEILAALNTPRCLASCGLFTGISILQPLFDPLWPTEDRLLGISDAGLSPLSSLLALCTFGLVIIVGSSLEILRAFAQRLTSGGSAVSAPSKTAPDVPPERAKSSASPVEATSWRIIAWSTLGPMFAVLALIHLILPQQLALVVLFFTMGIVYLTSPSGSPAAQSRTNLLASTLLLLTFLLPFNLVTLGVWARNLWLDWKSSFASDHNVARVVPLLVLVQLSSIPTEIRPRQIFIRLSQALLLMLSFSAFLFGARFTYILPYIADPLLLCLWGILWP